MEQEEIILFIIIVSLAIAAFISAILLFIVFYRKKMMLRIKENESTRLNHQKEILSTQIEIQTQTMQHIGREIHDNIGQKLTLASLYGQQLIFENKVPDSQVEIDKIVAIINQSLSELRELSKSLTDNIIDSQNIVKLLATECNKIKDLKVVTVHFSCNQKKINLDYQSKSILVRILQEFIQNSIKHAKSKNINIQLIKKDAFLELLLQDDGIGFDVSKTISNGIGLTNMKIRTEMIGGKFNLESNENGTSLKIIIPVIS